MRCVIDGEAAAGKQNPALRRGCLGGWPAISYCRASPAFELPVRLGWPSTLAGLERRYSCCQAAVDGSAPVPRKTCDRKLTGRAGLPEAVRPCIGDPAYQAVARSPCYVAIGRAPTCR
ncbi:hypothetical protein [Providencia sp. PROV043]|uniref:hypothetical protein n=1 Tax=Providencia sp. PROV043 TaxID=2949774 RepID=UPI002348F993|nr:hypothetical protein [Providencia sp. PROV043]